MPQGSEWGLNLFNNLINDLEDGENGMLMKFVSGTKLEVLPTLIKITKNFKNKLERLQLWGRKCKS